MCKQCIRVFNRISITKTEKETEIYTKNLTYLIRVNQYYLVSNGYNEITHNENLDKKTRGFNVRAK